MDILEERRNEVTVAGTLADNPVLKYSGRGIPYCWFTVYAFNRTEEGDYDRAYIPCVAFNGLAEKIGVKVKDDRIFIGGAISVSDYEKDGQKRKDFRVIARNLVEEEGEVWHNAVVLAGTLADYPSLRYSPSAVAHCRFTMYAFNRGSDSEYDRAYIPCIAFNRTAELIGLMQKDEHLFFQGAVLVSSYEKDGQKRKDHRVVVKNIIGGEGEKSVQPDSFAEDIGEPVGELVDVPF